MMVKAAPTATLEVSEAKLLLQFLVVALDPPAKLGDTHEFGERDVVPERAQPVLGRLRRAAWPFDEQPLLGPGLGPPVIAVRRTHAHARKARAKLAVGARPPRDMTPLLLHKRGRQRLDADGFVFGVTTQQFGPIDFVTRRDLDPIQFPFCLCLSAPFMTTVTILSRPSRW